MNTKSNIFLTCLLGSAICGYVIAQSSQPTQPATESTAPTTDSVEALRERITAKVERVKEGVQKWADSGRDPSAILKTMAGTIKPLLDAGKAIEAEAELNRLLEQLETDAKLTPPDNHPPARPRRPLAGQGRQSRV